MPDDKLYVKQNVLVEPLYNQWYAWSLLMAPETAAMCVANLHTKIMQSFISAPQIHMNAVKNPEMLGGPFVDYDESRVPDVQALLDKTQTEQADLIGFADAVKELDEILLNEAQGFSLEPIYPRVPDALKGYIELVYDLNNRASARFIEGLLYKSKFYRPQNQSISIKQVTEDYRPFILSTPRLDDPNEFVLKIPWSHSGIDELVRMKKTAQTFAHIKDALGFEDRFDDLFKTFLTPNPPKTPDKYSGDGMRIRYLGHACVLIESKDVSILTDPFISYDYPTEIERHTLADLPDTIDYILITHAHADHTALETLLQLRSKTRNIIVPKNGAGALQDPSLKLMLRNAGFPQVHELDEMEEISIPGGKITGMPFFGEHGDLNIRTKLAWHVAINGKTVLCTADSNNLQNELYQNMHATVGDLDVLFIGMECEGAPMSWLYGPLLTRPMPRRMDQQRRLDGSNCEKGMKIIEQFKPKHVYVYAMGQEPWLNHVMAIHYDETKPQIVESNKLIAECKARGLDTERVFCKKDLVL